MKAILTASKVNAELKKRGIAERLRQGRGYCYFTDGDASGWYTSTVPVCYVADLSMKRWLQELHLLRVSVYNIGRGGRS
jgi:hypothetical protein